MPVDFYPNNLTFTASTAGTAYISYATTSGNNYNHAYIDKNGNYKVQVDNSPKHWYQLEEPEEAALWDQI